VSLDELRNDIRQVFLPFGGLLEFFHNAFSSCREMMGAIHPADPAERILKTSSKTSIKI
jgi:hypothetical protein